MVPLQTQVNETQPKLFVVNLTFSISKSLLILYYFKDAIRLYF